MLKCNCCTVIVVKIGKKFQIVVKANETGFSLNRSKQAADFGFFFNVNNNYSMLIPLLRVKGLILRRNIDEICTI